jgi:hypothetical protein
MVDACEAGDLAQLQQLFHKYGVKQGDDPVKESWVLDLTAPSAGPKRYIHETVAQCGPPPTGRLFEAAILSKSPSMLLFLLKTYPKYNFWDCGIMDMALTKDDLAIFKEIYSHDTRRLTFSHEEDVTTEFNDATLAKFLSRVVGDSQRDADWLSREGNLSAALLNGTLVEAIDKILSEKPDSVGLSCLAKFALRKGRVEVLEMFCEKGKLYLEALSNEEMARAIFIGKQIDCHKLVAFLEDCLLKKEQQEGNTEQDSEVEKRSDPNINIPDRKWWQWRK